MSEKYLLKCECGEAHPVDTGQAGQSVSCKCGKELRVPSFREIKQLPPVKEDGPPRKREGRRGWHPVQGVLFGVGAVVILFCGAWAGYVQIYRNSLDTEAQDWDDVATAQDAIGNLSPADAYDNWRMISEIGLGERQPPSFVAARQEDRRWFRIQLIAYGVGGVGLLLVIGSLLIRPREVL